MTIKTLAARGTSCAEIGRLLNLPESNVRYHLARLRENVVDGRSFRPRRASAFAEAVGHWMSTHKDRATNLAALHDWLVAEHAYPGSLRSVQRFVADRYGPPAKRARRRVETPPGAQAQVDWAIFPSVAMGGQRIDLSALLLNLSFSRFSVMLWSRRRDQLSWIAGHNGAMRRIDGVPAVIRIDNDSAAVARGAGPWGVISEPYRRYAITMRFHIDLCQPRQPQAKGKVERRVRSHRQCVDPYAEHWRDLEQLQAWTDATLLRDAARRTCPATGTTVAEAFSMEQPLLGALPPRIPEPFDSVATRTVSTDALIGFEGRQYSVPFAHVGQRVEARGCAGKVQIIAGNIVVAEHERGSAQRIVLDPAHYDGPSTDRVLAPQPLGRMGLRLQELASLPVEHRSVDLYAFLAEDAQ